MADSAPAKKPASKPAAKPSDGGAGGGVTSTSQLIHAFLTSHPVGRAIAAHTQYGPGHPVHDVHAKNAAPGVTPNLQQVNPTLMRTPAGPINPMLMQRLMAQRGGGSPMAGPPPPMPGGPPSMGGPGPSPMLPPPPMGR